MKRLLVALANLVQGVVYGVAFGHLGKFAMVAVYFILTQWLHGQYIGSWHAWNVKYVWDHLLSANPAHGGLHAWLSVKDWNNVRHVVRPFGEGLYGGLLYQLIGANPVKHQQRAGAVRIVSLPVTVGILGGLLAVPLFLWAAPALHYLTHSHALEVALTHHPALWQKIYNDTYDALLVGLVVSFLVHRYARPALATIMVHFCRILRDVGFHPHWWMPVGMRRQLEASREQGEAFAHEGGLLAGAIIALALVTLALAVYGFYILTIVAS